MYLTIKQPKNKEEFKRLKVWLVLNNVKIAVNSIKYALDYCDYSNWDNKFSSLSVSTNSSNENWTAKCTSSQRDLEINHLQL